MSQIYHINIDGKQYNCARMGATDQFEISHLLGQHRILLMANDKKHVAAIVTALMAIPLHDARQIAEAVTSQAFVSGSQNEKVTPATFSDDVGKYWRLVAELIVENFQKLSSYLREESKKLQEQSESKKAKAIQY